MANTLRRHRKARRLKQLVIAEQTGVSKTTISALETTGDKPTAEVAVALAAFFGVKVKALFPDGVRERHRSGRPRKELEYVPPEPPVEPPPRYPPEFMVLCPKCRSRIFIAVDKAGGMDLCCPSCSQRFEVRQR